MLTLGSLFDGIGTWQLSATKAGIKPVYCSEIDDFPATVSAYHFPKTKQLGDITKIDVNELEPVDIICAGSPCQDLSVAGKRKGLEGERSGLFVDAIKLVHGLRERTGKPRYFVWENVPGAFSSNKGHDFAAVLSEITKTEIPMPKDGRWAESGCVEWGGTSSLAWRTLDAQYWGVPQRRKRIFLVADFGGFTAGEILFVEQGLHGDSAESKGERQEIAADVGTSIDSAIGVDIYNNKITGDKVTALTTNNTSTSTAPKVMTSVDSASGFKYRQGAKAGGIGYQKECAPTLEQSQNCAVHVIENHPQDSRVKYRKDGVVQTLSSQMGTGGGNVPMIHKAIGFMPQMKAESMTPMVEKSPCLVNGTNPGWQNGVYCVGNGQVAQTRISDKVGTLNCMHDQQAVMVNKSIRRLTPTECERLQGLPDSWTDVEFNGKPAPDSKRYKAIGNGMAVPCSDFIMRRIVEVSNGQNKGHD
jgi:DNA (cytosine-5)-methyltransferase 1